VVSVNTENKAYQKLRAWLLESGLEVFIWTEDSGVPIMFSLVDQESGHGLTLQIMETEEGEPAT
jgi:hypothetical protein